MATKPTPPNNPPGIPDRIHDSQQDFAVKSEGWFSWMAGAFFPYMKSLVKYFSEWEAGLPIVDAATKADRNGNATEKFKVADGEAADEAVSFKQSHFGVNLGDTDLNDFKTFGKGTQTESAKATTSRHYPPWATSAGQIENIDIGGGWISQQYREYRNKRSISERYYNPNDNTWSDWIMIGGITLGSNYKWVDVKSSRDIGTTYTNTHNGSIMVSFQMYGSSSETSENLSIDSSGFYVVDAEGIGDNWHSWIFPVGAGETYKVTWSGSTPTYRWREWVPRSE